MKKMRDPAIKLFGKEIALSKTGRAAVVSGGDEKQGKEEDELECDKDSQQDNIPPPSEEDETPCDSEDDPKTPPILKENTNEIPMDTENNLNETNNSDQKPLKKPDKILPCPRCNSMDTKFCYYNNYNVNQPRHFCKACQRYWTAGGTTRNVPVGAGRRKNKNSASHYRHITISEATKGVLNPIYGTNATVLSFGPETSKNGSVFRNKIFKAQKESKSDCSSGTSVITNLNEGGILINANGLPIQAPCLQGFPWPYPAMPNLSFCPPGYPIPVYPIPYWNSCFPWIAPPCGMNQTLPNPSPISPLGKHSRSSELLNPLNAENKELEDPRSCNGTVLIPKTLRIDDPDEAAKSSIWATLGIKNDLINRKCIFKAFESKGDGKRSYAHETPESMRANPAAMSRSVNFQETA